MNRFLIAAAIATSSSVAAAQEVRVTLSEWKLVMSRDTVSAGTVTFRINNEGNMDHAFYVLGAGVEKGTREIAKRESASLTVVVKPGTYELYCPQSDGSHKMAGMHKTLVVVPAAAPQPKPPV